MSPVSLLALSAESAVMLPLGLQLFVLDCQPRRSINQSSPTENALLRLMFVLPQWWFAKGVIMDRSRACWRSSARTERNFKNQHIWKYFRRLWRFLSGVFRQWQRAVGLRVGSAPDCRKAGVGGVIDCTADATWRGMMRLYSSSSRVLQAETTVMRC